MARVAIAVRVMSSESSSTRQVPALQPEPEQAGGGAFATGASLHPRLRAQLNALGSDRTLNPTAAMNALLPLISRQYHEMDAERRGVVRSMQLLAAEARDFAHGLKAADAGQLRVILDHIKDVVVTVTGEGAICVFNPTGERLFGFSQDELVGVSLARLLPELPVQGSLPRGLQAIAADSAAGARRRAEPRLTRARRKDGSMFPVEIVASHVQVERRDLFVVCLRDMNEQLNADRALRDSEARYRTLVESAPEVIVVIDAQTGRCTDANDNALRFFGIRREQVATLDLRELLQAARSSPARAGAPAAPEDSPQSFEWRHRRADGQLLTSEARLLALPGSTGLLRVSLTDITDRKHAETILAGERDVFARIAADAPLADVLAATVALAEDSCGDCVVSIGRLAPDAQRFAEVIGARLPESWRTAELNAPIDVRNGSSAAAVYLGRAVLVGDVRTDPYWQRRRNLALAAGFSAAWAVPIKAAGGRVLGALTVYRNQPGKPHERELELLGHAARLAALAIERCYAAEALRESEARFRGLYETVLEGVYRISPDGKIIDVNPACVRLLGYDNAQEIYALPAARSLFWESAAHTEFVQLLERSGSAHAVETLMRRRDGAQLVVLMSAHAVRDARQQIVAYEGTLADITERKRVEQAIFEEKERAQVTLQSIGDGVISTDREGCIEYLNPVAEQLSGWPAAEARGASIMDVLRLRDEMTHAEIENPLLRCLREDRVVHFGESSVLINRLGQEIAIQDSAAPIRDRGGRTVGAVVVFRDVTKERRLKHALSYQASHDALTGLINRREFDLRLGEALQSAREGGDRHALLYVDLDQFKVVNDTCGHAAGDRLLRDITGLLQRHVRSADVIARLGGDEFGILARHCTLEQATRIAEQIREAVRDHRFHWEQNTATIGASIGVAAITRDSDSVASVLSAADMACYEAKDSGRNRVHVHDASAASGRFREMYWVSRLSRALEAGQLELHAQPIVAVRADAPRQPPFEELLLRLREEDGSLVLPGEFMPAAERHNMTTAIDRWAVGQAVARLRERLASGEELPLLAVNLSGSSLNDRDFVDYVLAQVQDGEIGRGLCFDITEAALLSGAQPVVSFMQAVRQHGCRIALDDFGTNLSSFHFLKQYPVDFLKIDGKLLGELGSDAVDRGMIEAIAKVAGTLGVATIAERVESALTLDRLRELGIDYAQGFYLS